jgi:hypothetical protein
MFSVRLVSLESEWQKWLRALYHIKRCFIDMTKVGEEEPEQTRCHVAYIIYRLAD